MCSICILRGFFSDMKPLYCYECQTSSDDPNYCSDPFNATMLAQNVSICEGHCVKWVRQPRPGQCQTFSSITVTYTAMNDFQEQCSLSYIYIYKINIFILPYMNIRRSKNSSFLCELFNGSRCHIFNVAMIHARAYGLTVALNYND